MRTIGKYEILGLLGIGGMGRVYKVRLPVADRIVALKLCRPREELELILGLEEIEALFLDEVRVLGSMRDKHVVSVLDFDRDAEGRPFFVMEYYCLNLGLLLGERYEEGPARRLTVDKAAHYGRQALLGLERLHWEGVLHRDVKPFNMLVTPEDTLKLIDFGLSRVRGEGRGDRAQPGGLKIGTPFYTAPEQEASAQAADERSDLYSMGVTLWRMLTGHLPGQVAQVAQPGQPGKDGGGRLPSELCPALDAGWDDFLLRAAHPKPAQRFQNARDMRLALDKTHADWRERLAKACGLEEPREGSAPSRTLTREGAVLPGPPIHLQSAQLSWDRPSRPRSTPIRVRPAEARSVFPVDEFFRPLVYASGEFSADAGGFTVAHAATGLVWERAGSDFPLQWEQSQEYVEELNQAGFAGHADWRLPTLDELLTILAPSDSLGDYCLQPLFDTTQLRLWSADRATFVSAWYADAELGFVAAQDFTCFFHARAVRGPA